jgi:hypothetical protein
MRVPDGSVDLGFSRWESHPGREDARATFGNTCRRLKPAIVCLQVKPWALSVVRIRTLIKDLGPQELKKPI